MRVRIHRGACCIGGICVEVEHGGERILLDLGQPLDAERAGPELLPPVSGLDGSDPSLCGILVTHGHLDHYGLVPLVDHRVPFYMGAAARRILDAARFFQPDSVPKLPPSRPLVHCRALDIGPFRVFPRAVDHAAADAYLLDIEAGGRRLVYTGDLRGHGRKAGLFEALINRPPPDVDALLLEGTTVESPERVFKTESTLELELEGVVRKTRGPVFVLASGQNIDRVVTCCRAAMRAGRTFVIDAYVNAVLRAHGNSHLPAETWPDVRVLVTGKLCDQLRRTGGMGLLPAKKMGCAAFRKVLPRAVCMVRESMWPLLRNVLSPLPSDRRGLLVYSMWRGYLAQGRTAAFVRAMEGLGLGLKPLHTSGHASPNDLRRLVEAMKPGCVVPIHTEAASSYPEVFPDARVCLHPDGEWWDV